jgi:hypothetical protein
MCLVEPAFPSSSVEADAKDDEDDSRDALAMNTLVPQPVDE